MKKTLTIYLSVLVVLFIVFSILGRGGDYAVEQKLWKINQQYVEVAKDPGTVSDNTYNSIITQYRDVIKKYSESNVIKGVYLLLGEVYLLKSDYETARKTYEEMMNKYSGDKALASEGYARIARSYELENNWAKSEEIYMRMIQEYPLTDVGLGASLYIANYYRKNNDFKNSIEAYDRAMRFYGRVAKEHENTKVGFDALRYLANCHLEQNRWDEAVKILGDVLLNYNTSEYMNIQRADTIIKTINMVAAFRMKDNSAATKIYAQFVKENPDHALSAYLHKMIEAFQKLEAEGIQLDTEK